MFWWMPEIKRGYYLPEFFAMFRPSSNNAGAGFAMWYVWSLSDQSEQTLSLIPFYF